MKSLPWDNNDLGITFSITAGRITIFKTTVKALGFPPYYRFLLDADNRQFAIECCGYMSNGSHSLPGYNTKEHYDIKSRDLVRFIYQTCGWDTMSSYRVKGKIIPERMMVVFDLTSAMCI